MAELLLELFSEEIPAGMQRGAREDLARLLGALLEEHGLGTPDIRTFSTPRRLVAVADGVAERQPDRVIERRGPRVDAPQTARVGFLRSLEGRDYRLEEREDAKKGRYLVALVEERGRPAAEVLAETLPELLARFPWPRSMRWGAHRVRWVRPLHAILCLLDGRPLRFAFGPVESGDVTYGHRFHAPGPISVRDYADYREALRRAYVMLDQEERARTIVERARALAAAEGLRLREDPELVEELAGLVEWPVVLIGSIEPAFMELPPEVLVTSMRTHQRYLALEDGDGRLAPRFVVVANVEAADGGEAVVAGNERVLRARLWDARFFWETDRRVPLEARLPMLERVVFHQKLGTMAERVERLERLARELARFVPGADAELCARAARLCKADLMTGMVAEFPELQGIMGGYYARHQGEPEEVARAIAEHYRPKGPDDAVPRAPVSVAVALTDRIDTLAGFFAAGIRPSGSKDPFALRRAALGVIRLLLENGLRLPLREVFSCALDLYGRRFHAVDREAFLREVLEFFADRLVVSLRGRGLRHDLVAAVFAIVPDDDLARLVARVEALDAFLASPDGRDLLTAYRRARNIVAIEERRDGREYRGEPDPALLAQDEERALYAVLVEAEDAIAAALVREDFTGAMRHLAAIRPMVDAFFERVRVNVEDPHLRENRLLLLDRLRRVFERIADFSRIEDRDAGESRDRGSDGETCR
ncbi:Glycine--tRNA ligase beta subunit [bacterium HR39]|nr:Glycine--tRNA ligase beta subunit [bacterium HR39]